MYPGTGRFAPYLRAFGVLLVAAAALAAWVAISGCGFCGLPETDPTSPHAQQVDATPPKRLASIAGDKSDKKPGDRVTRTISGYGPSDDSMNITYYPPKHATNITLDPPPEPGGPPFKWHGVQGEGNLITVSYDVPEIHPGEGMRKVSDSVHTSTVSGSHMEHLAYDIVDLPGAAGSEPTGHEEAMGIAVPTSRHAFDEQVTAWKLTRWIDFNDEPLTSELCRDWIEWLSDDQAFWAVRMPVQASSAPTRSVPLPFFTTPENPATLCFVSAGGLDVHYAADIAFRGERMDFVANALPQAEGEVWIPLGVSTDAPAVPDGISVEADRWSLFSEMVMDLSSQPDSGQGLIQPLYYCYEGADQPRLSQQLEGMALALGYRREGGLQVVSYPDWCITCMGPQQVAMPARDSWRMGSSNSALVEAGDTVRFQHSIGASREQGVSVQFTVSSTLDLTWSLFGGDFAEPDLEQPITDTFIVETGHAGYVWLISQPVPEGVADGPYSVRLTAEDTEGATRWASDVLWVGEWVSPVDKYVVHVPLIIRER